MFCLRGFSVFTSCVALLLVVRSSHGSEIIGGKEVEPHSLPYMALLVSDDKDFCGGTLINLQWVLTAAHCTCMNKVLLGVHSVKEKEKDSRQVRKVKEHIPHPGFDCTERVNDLQLLKLDKPVKQTETVKYLKLGKTIKDPAAGSTCLVAGWGVTNEEATDSPQMSDVLMSAHVAVIDRAACNKYYNRKPVITSSMICAGSTSQKKADTCSGDSGGPLLCNGALVGVTSFGGSKCGDVKKPGVYSFLSGKHLDWIKKTMKSSEI